MPLTHQGSCRCRAVLFSVESYTPYPYQLCYRTICRKTAGGGERHFCTRCATALWVWDPNWPDLVHPFASAIDSDLPVPTSRVHLMLNFKAPWVAPQVGSRDQCFDRYPAQSIEEWHRSRGLWID